MRAADEFDVQRPLREAGLTKADVRRYARAHSLPVADKPAAACLASRIPVGTVVTAAALDQVERAEEAVRRLGFRILRVRHHGPRARLEVGKDERARAADQESNLRAALLDCGFIDLEVATYRAPPSALEDR